MQTDCLKNWPARCRFYFDVIFAQLIDTSNFLQIPIQPLVPLVDEFAGKSASCSEDSSQCFLSRALLPRTTAEILSMQDVSFLN